MNLEAIGRSWRAWVVGDPLERGRWWAPYVWTFIFCVAIAVGFSPLGFTFNGVGGIEVPAARLWHLYQLNC